MNTFKTAQIPEPPISRFILGDTRLAPLWLVIRLYAGWVWLEAGWMKVNSSAWVGSDSGKALTGFIMGALKKPQEIIPMFLAGMETFCKILFYQTLQHSLQL